MKVGLDISQLAHTGGVGVYTQNLAEQLVRISDLEVMFFYSSLRKPYYGNLPNVKSFRLPPTLFEFVFNKFRLIPIERLIGPVDVFHSSDWVQPPTAAKKVTTYHDVVPLKYPQWSHNKIIEVHKRRLKLVEKEVDMVIAVSQSTRSDLLEISSLSADKITVVYEAAGEQFKVQPAEKVSEFRRKFNLPEEFVLAIGGVGERRNLGRVKQAAGAYNLVVTGETIPWIPYKDLPLLYSAAKVLLYPSFYEGFGLPILEAMSCGIPVITSNISSMPEIGGKAALYVNPDSLSEIEKKLKQVTGDKELRRKMITEGLEQSKKFSWGESAHETVEIYRKVYAP